MFTQAWHVDYWDYLGHHDKYAAPAHTDRQKNYAIANQEQNLFTPHILINGVTQKNLGLIDGAIEAALTQQVATSTTVWLDDTSAWPNLVVNFRVEGAPAGTELVVSLLESGLTTLPIFGENKGKTLSHENSVRGFVTAAVSESPAVGQVQLVAPGDAVQANAGISALVQTPVTMELHGATLIRTIP